MRHFLSTRIEDGFLSVGSERRGRLTRNGLDLCSDRCLSCSPRLANYPKDGSERKTPTWPLDLQREPVLPYNPLKSLLISQHDRDRPATVIASPPSEYRNGQELRDNLPTR